MAKKKFSKGDKLAAEVVTVYVATCNEDGTEGRGATIDHSYHLTKHAALIATAGIGVMGSDGDLEERLALKLEDGRFALLPDIFQISDNVEKEAELRKEALKKLSPAELAALTRIK
jgi:hypothetical protein